MADLSGYGDLLKEFLTLPSSRAFLHGEQNQLSYLRTLQGGGVEVAEIPFSGHWPMCSHAVAIWTTLARTPDRDVA